MVETLLEQYRQTPTIEWFAFFFGVLQVIFAYWNRSINFLFGAISVCAYIYIFFRADLLAESILNIYYLIISIWGLIQWNRKQATESRIHKATRKDWQVTFLIISFCLVAIISIYYIRQLNDGTIMNASHYVDGIVTAFAFGGTYLLLKRCIETWILLNFSNLIAMPLQWSKGLYLTALLTLILFLVAVAGYFRWKKEIKEIQLQS